MAWNPWLIPVLTLLIPVLPMFGIQLLLLIFILRFFLKPKPSTIGFMHPNASCRGGGERVLWAMVQSLRKHFKSLEIIIYLRADEKLSDQEIIHSTKKCFGLDLAENPPKFVRVKSCKFADPHRYKFLTLILEALGSAIATCEAVFRQPVETFVDTTGYGFALSLPKILTGCRTMAYVHYPIISTEMIQAIYAGKNFNNSGLISSSNLLKNGKFVYYNILHAIYKLSIASCDHVWANSTWTKGHIGENASILYPPCETAKTADFSADRENLVISVAQFRPEKNHKMLIDAFAEFLGKLDKPDYRLVMIGGCRNAEDEARMAELRDLSEKLRIQNQVEFKPNLPYPELQEYQRKAKIGMHAMVNEHFGIVIVEFQANGVIPLAHNSAGPKEDIIKSEFGYLASSREEFTEALLNISKLSNKELVLTREANYKHSLTFAHDKFIEEFAEAMKKFN